MTSIWQCHTVAWQTLHWEVITLGKRPVLDEVCCRLNADVPGDRVCCDFRAVSESIKCLLQSLGRHCSPSRVMKGAHSVLRIERMRCGEGSDRLDFMLVAMHSLVSRCVKLSRPDRASELMTTWLSGPPGNCLEPMPGRPVPLGGTFTPPMPGRSPYGYCDLYLYLQYWSLMLR